MSSTGIPLAPAHCPLCGRANQCAMEVARETGATQPPCWCTQVDFSRELLARLPEQARGKACICQSCAQALRPGQTGNPPTNAPQESS